MRKIRILAALLALLLCMSMLLTACGNKDKEEDGEDETEGTTEPVEDGKEELPTAKLSDIMNKDWKAPVSKNGVITKYTELAFKGNYSSAQGSFIVTKESNPTDATFPENAYNKNIVRVYNVNTAKELVATNDYRLEDYKEEAFSYSTTYYYYLHNYVNNYVHVINDDYFSVLNVNRLEIDTNSYAGGNNYTSYTSNCFGTDMYDFNDDKADVYDEFVKYTLTIYNSEGKVVRTIDNEQLKKLCNDNIRYFDSYYNYGSSYTCAYKDVIAKYQPETEGGMYNEDLYVKDGKVYRVDKDKKHTLIKDYGIAKMPNVLYLDKVGDYYVESDGTVIVYDKNLNKVFDYTAPGYAYTMGGGLLANGSFLLQYRVQLDQYAENYDYRAGADGKYDLVTVLVNKDGATELEDVDYVIGSVVACAADSDGQKIYTDSLANTQAGDDGITLFAYNGTDMAGDYIVDSANADSNEIYSKSIENLALIYPIGENKMLDKSYENMKLVILSNDCKSITEIVADEKIVDFPVPVTDDLFAVNVLGGGKVLYTENGEKYSELENFESVFAGKYILTKEAIYDLKGAKVYDFKKNEAKYTRMGDVLFITAIDANGNVKYSLWTNGTATEVKGDVVEISSNGYYVVKNETVKDGKTVKTYSYFNSKGTLIGTFDYQLSCMGVKGDVVIMAGNDIDEADNNKIIYKFYAFTITK